MHNPIAFDILQIRDDDLLIVIAYLVFGIM